MTDGTAGGHSKAFSVIFSKANAYLERVFSMKFVAVTEKKTWILISTLPDQSLVRKDAADILNMIILVIIFGSNHSITHDTLLRILNDINIDDNYLYDEGIAVPSVTAYLGLLVKQNYLEKESSPDYESPLYTWGRRAKIEVPPEVLIRFITSVITDYYNFKVLELDSVSKTKLSKELFQRIQGQQFY